MSDDDDTLTASATLTKARMEAFSDGVLAIAITLLVLEVAVRPPGSPLEQFLRGWPSYLGYLVSFLTIGGVWIAHNGLTDDLDHVDRLFLRINLLFLLVVAFLPFPTRLVAESVGASEDSQRVAAVVYGVTLLLMRLLFAGLSAYSHRARLRRAGPDDADLQDAGRKFVGAAAAYVATVGIAFVAPIVAISLYFAIAVFLFVPFKTVADALFARRSPSPGR